MTSVKDETAMKTLGERLGGLLTGGEVIELIGDVGAGKTTLVKGVGRGLRVDDDVQSPSFTISRIYGARDGLKLHHYDFYRLHDAGVMAYELSESIADPKAITIIEWADTVQAVLPAERISLRLLYSPDGDSREVNATVSEKYSYLRGAFV